MMNFCTLFDKNYISKGIALYLSLEKYTEDFILYVMAMDRKCESLLKGMDFKHMVVECIEDNMSPELMAVKATRSVAEYCWTCGSYVTHLFFEKHGLPDITYLDSDLMFFNSPSVIFDELESKDASVGLSPHFISNTIFGTYCVQYVYFRRDSNGCACLDWWYKECLRWCYSKLEDGKYGDQLYLDQMKGKFPGVVDIENRGAGIANWNQEQYKYSFADRTLSFKGKSYPIVFFHYNGLNVNVDNGMLKLRYGKYFTPPVVEGFIMPYVALLKEVYSKYLSASVDSYEYEPLSWWKNILTAGWTYVRRNPVAEFAERLFMNAKYSRRKSPYSERNR